MSENLFLELKNSNFTPNKQLLVMKREESEQKIEKETNIYSSEKDFLLAKETLHAQITKALAITVSKSETNNVIYDLRLTLHDIAGQTETFDVPNAELKKPVEEIMVGEESLFERIVRILIYKDVNPVELHKFIEKEENKGKSFKEIIKEYEAYKLEQEVSTEKIKEDTEETATDEAEEPTASATEESYDSLQEAEKSTVDNTEQPVEATESITNENSEVSAESEEQNQTEDTVPSEEAEKKPKRKRRKNTKAEETATDEAEEPTASATEESNISLQEAEEPAVGNTEQPVEAIEEKAEEPTPKEKPVVMKMEGTIKPTTAVAKEIELTFTASGVINFVTDVCSDMNLSSQEIENAKLKAKTRLSAMVTEMIMKL